MFNVKKSDRPAGDFKYNDGHIIKLVRADFFDKCYLCEEKTPRHLEVEHFYPKAYHPDKIHDWDNLICICEKCNKIRPKKINTNDVDMVLNPCIDDAESLILLKYNPADSSISISSAEKNIVITNSIELLQRIHNGVNTASFSYVDLRKLIAEEIAALEDDINNLNTYLLEKPFREKIRKKLSRQSAFFAVKKIYIIENNPELSDLIEK
jgi:HNH endonuclease